MSANSVNKKYREAVQFLYKARFFGMKLGLQNIRYMLDELGSPEQQFFTVHIAGTNGKGSVAAMTESVLRAAGYLTGLFTSPHISSFRERFRVNGEMINCSDVIRIVNLMKPISEKMKLIPAVTQPTFFEIVTAMAAQYFAEKHIDVAVIETGLGGRLDATNVFQSKLNVITGIGFEHQEHLGDTIEQIAAEKAGIIKEGADVIVGEQELAALAVVEETAKQKNARLIRVGRDIKWSNRKTGEMTQFADIHAPLRTYKQVECPLLGVHQIGNLCAVIGAIEALQVNGYKISETALRQGIKETQWHARFQVVKGNPTFILDTAANPHAAKTVAATLNEWKKPAAPFLLIFGMLNDKNPLAVGEILFPIAEEVILTQSENDRALTVGQLQEKLATLLHGKKVSAISSLSEALSYASRKMKDTGGYVLVTGSLFLMGRTLDFLKLAPMEDDFGLTDSVKNNT